MFDFNTPITKDTNLVGQWKCSSGPTPEPGVYDFANLKLALGTGEPEKYFPIGTEIPDTYSGFSYSLIVGAYTEISGKKAAGLVRSSIFPANIQFDSSTFKNYPTSYLFQYLQSTYLNDCSAELKAAISTVSVPWWNGSGIEQVSGKWHLLSGIEVCGTINSGEGEAWELWKQRTGLSTPSDAGNTGRVVKNWNGGDAYYWLRSMLVQSGKYYQGGVSAGNTLNPGTISGNSANANYVGLLPICYILAD